MASLGQILVWWLLSLVLGFITLPVATKVFRFLPDKGLGLARVLGLLITAYLAWVLGFVFNSVATSAVAFLGLAGLSAWIYTKDKAGFKALIREQGSLILVYESLFLFLLILWALVRMHNPDVLNTEKFMDFAFFNTLQRAGHFPPYDPWLAAPKNYINYYYFGYFSMASFARLTFLEPAVCYNLVIAFVFALSGQAVFSIGYNCTKALWPGFVGVAMLQLFGNLHGGLQWLSSFSLKYFDWWAPTRLIKDVSKASGGYVNDWWWSASPEVLKANNLPESAARDGLISEFPNFSFIHGDMHPHFTAIPFVLLALGLGLNLIKSDDRDPLNVLDSGSGRLTRGLGLGVLALALGAVFMANTWDLPAYGLTLSLLLLLQQHGAKRLNGDNWLKGWLLPSAFLFAGFILFSSPFWAFFSNPAKRGLGLAKAHTGMHDTLIFWGPFLAVMLPFLVLRVRLWGRSLAGGFSASASPAKAKASSSASKTQLCEECGARLRPGKPFCAQCGHKNTLETQRKSDASSSSFGIDSSGTPPLAASLLKLFYSPSQALKDGRVGWIAGVTAVVLLALLIIAPTSFLFLTLALLAALLVASRSEKPEALFALALVLIASLLVVGVEWVYVRDVFEDNPSLTRMNSVFKFYFQAWILFAAAAPFALYWSFNALNNFAGDIASNVYRTVLGILFFLAAIYPLGAFNAVATNFGNDAGFSPTLDGSAWLKRDYPGDYEMIGWMRSNIKGKAVIAEAVGGAYTRFARVASYTGLAAVVGWGNHESQWRQVWPTQTEADVNRLYETMDPGEAMSLVKKYGVQYVFCGSLERGKYSPDQLNKFRVFMETVRDNGQGTVLYKTRE